jgi:hypothetical protein
MLRRFFQSHDIKTGKQYFNRAWRVEVGTVIGVHFSLKSMLPFLFKKAAEAKATIEYLTDGITGDQLQDIFEHAVRIGDRERVGKRVSLPWTRSEGLRRASKYVASFAGVKPKLGPQEEDEIVRDYQELGLSQRGIAATRGHSRGLVQSILARHGVAA